MQHYESAARSDARPYASADVWTCLVSGLYHNFLFLEKFGSNHKTLRPGLVLSWD